MSGLTEFLLARIAEDEANARGSLTNASYQDPVPSDCWDSDRVLAECEAKRQQIAHLIRFMGGDYAPWHEEQLQIMATVYAEHPGYREGWRP